MAFPEKKRAAAKRQNNVIGEMVAHSKMVCYYI